jgi:hypothetical protein
MTLFYLEIGQHYHHICIQKQVDPKNRKLAQPWIRAEVEFSFIN